MQWCEYRDYRLLLKHFVNEKKSVVPGFTLQKLAETCKIQKGYLSRALQLSVDLSRDQVYLLTEALHLDSIQKQFAFLLHDYNRTGVAKRRANLLEDIYVLVKDVNRTERMIRPGTVIRTTSEYFSSYFTDPKTQIVHMMLSIPRFRENISKITQTLGISTSDLEKCISILKNLNLVEIRDERIIVLNDELHLPADHSLFPAYKTLMRASALGKIQNLPEDASFNYTAIFTGAASTKNYIRSKFLDFLRDVQTTTAKEKSMDVYQLNFDIFKWS